MQLDDLRFTAHSFGMVIGLQLCDARTVYFCELIYDIFLRQCKIYILLNIFLCPHQTSKRSSLFLNAADLFSRLPKFMAGSARLGITGRSASSSRTTSKRVGGI